MISYTHLYKQKKLLPSCYFRLLCCLGWLTTMTAALHVVTACFGCLHTFKEMTGVSPTYRLSLLYHFDTERIFQVCPSEFRFLWWMLKGKASEHPEESPEFSLPKRVAMRVTWKCKAVVQRPSR